MNNDKSKIFNGYQRLAKRYKIQFTVANVKITQIPLVKKLPIAVVSMRHGGGLVRRKSGEKKKIQALPPAPPIPFSPTRLMCSEENDARVDKCRCGFFPLFLSSIRHSCGNFPQKNH